MVSGFREFPYGSPDYTASLALRKAVLRTPLGLDWEPDAFKGEDRSFHLGAFFDDLLIGSLILKPLSATELRMRQVAISTRFQGQGLGTRLITFAEAFARERAYQQITAHARDSALSFYQRLGYSAIGPSFDELSLPHRLITRNLT